MKYRRNESRFDHHYFDLIDTEQRAYWLGFLMADGCIRDTVERGAMELSIHLAGKDINQLEAFRSAIRATKRINLMADGSVRFGISSDRICSCLIAYGCTPRKSLTLRFPQIDISLERHFIRGYFDGDGSASLHNGRLFVSIVGTKQFLEEVKGRLGIANKVISHPGCYQLMINNTSHLPYIYDYFYRNSSVYLERKRRVFDEGLNPPMVVRVCRLCGIHFVLKRGRGRMHRRYCSDRCRGIFNKSIG